MPNENLDIYSTSWSQSLAERNAALASMVTHDITYTDPTVALIDHEILSAYMGEFQKQFPDIRFKIIDVQNITSNLCLTGS